MEGKSGSAVIRIVAGDLTRQKVDAVVNAANPSLMGGGGVDGAIHRAGGPSILEECKAVVTAIGRLDTGKAVVTTGGSLPARRVIHTVGPVWRGGGAGESALLTSAFRSSLAAADGENLGSVAFPAISTGVYGYPAAEAARVALAAIRDYLEEGSRLREVRIVLFDAEAVRIWELAFEELGISK